jgi:4-hydroxyphenylpyruvate dioxygenase-like putative hemolysin
MKRREQAKLHALDEDQIEVQRSEVDDGDLDVLQSNVKFASLKEQALFYGDILDDDPIDYHDVAQRNWQTLSMVFSQDLSKPACLEMVDRVCDSS